MRLLVALIAISAFAQTRGQVVLTGPANAKAGDTVTVAVNLNIPSGVDLVAVQWSLPKGATNVTTASGVQANKSVICSSLTCLAVGIVPYPFVSATRVNAAPVTSGPLQTFQYVIPANQTPGPLLLNTSQVFGISSTAATAIVDMIGFTITIASDPLDLNGDGIVDMKDASQAFTVWQGSTSINDLVTLIKLCIKLGA